MCLPIVSMSRLYKHVGVSKKYIKKNSNKRNNQHLAKKKEK